jgi:hypothetical protein
MNVPITSQSINVMINHVIFLYSIFTTSLWVSILFLAFSPRSYLYFEVVFFDNKFEVLKVGLTFLSIELFYLIKQLFILDFSYFKHGPPGTIKESLESLQVTLYSFFKFQIFFVTNFETIVEEVIYSCFIFTKTALTSSWITLSFVILNLSYSVRVSFLEIGAFEILYILLFLFGPSETWIRRLSFSINFYISTYFKHLMKDRFVPVCMKLVDSFFKLLFLFIINVETLIEKIIYPCFIFIKMIVTSSLVTISYVILGPRYFVIFLSLYMLLLYFIDIYNIPIILNFIHGGTIKEGPVIDCMECLKSFCYETDKFKSENDETKWCQSCQMNYFKKNFKNWTSGNIQIDNYIQKNQLEKINDPKYTIFEWIHFFNIYNVEKIENYDRSCKLYSAMWRDGPLYYDFNKRIYKRKSNRKVGLRLLENLNKSLNITEFLSEV